MIVAAAYLAYRVFVKPGPKIDVWMKTFLALAFAWNATVFFLVFVRNPLSMAIGTPLFLIASILFIVDIFTKRTHFRLPESRWTRGFTIKLRLTTGAEIELSRAQARALRKILGW